MVWWNFVRGVCKCTYQAQRGGLEHRKNHHSWTSYCGLGITITSVQEPLCRNKRDNPSCNCDFERKHRTNTVHLTGALTWFIITVTGPLAAALWSSNGDTRQAHFIAYCLQRWYRRYSYNGRSGDNLSRRDVSTKLYSLVRTSAVPYMVERGEQITPSHLILHYHKIFPFIYYACARVRRGSHGHHVGTTDTRKFGRINGERTIMVLCQYPLLQKLPNEHTHTHTNT